VTVSNEGEYWPGRNEAALSRNLEQMSGAIAAAAGAMKDFDKASGAAGVQSPILGMHFTPVTPTGSVGPV